MNVFDVNVFDVNVFDVTEKIHQMCSGLSKTCSDPEEIAQIINDHFLNRLKISPDLLLFSWKNAAKKGGLVMEDSN